MWMVCHFSLLYDLEKHKGGSKNMNNPTEITKQDADMAQFRFALIAPVVQGLFPDSSATA